MRQEVTITTFTPQEEQNTNNALVELGRSEEAEKILRLIFQSSKIPIPVSLELMQKIHQSSIDLETESSGELNAGAMLLAAAGKPKFRNAHYATTFILTDKTGDESGKKKNKDPYSSCIIETLGALGARKGELAGLMNSQSFITAIDAKRLKIIDDAGLVKNKYKKEKKKEEASSNDAAAPEVTE